MRNILFIIFALSILGCREDFEPTPYTYSKLLTGETKKAWKLAALQYRSDERPLITYDLPLDDCAFDDLYIFYADDTKTFEIDEGVSKCNPDDPQLFITDNWSLVNATATLEMVIPILIPFRYPYIIKELSEKRLMVEVYFIGNKESYRMIFIPIKS